MFDSFKWLFEYNIFLGIFVWSMLECSIIPSPAEVVIIPLVILTKIDPIYVGLFGCIGSILGGLIDYYIGLNGYSFIKRFFNVEEHAKNYLKKFERFGRYSLIVGMVLGRMFPLSLKPLLFLAGMIKMNKILYIFLIGATSFIRYYFVSYIALQFT